MATIKIKGLGTREIPLNKALTLKKGLDDGTIQNHEWISIDKISFRAGDITAVTTDRVEIIQEGKNNEKVEQDYYQDRKKFLALSTEEKAKKMYFFQLFYKIMTDTDPTEEMMQKVEKIQADFFQENPYRMYISPKLFKPVMTGKGAQNGRFFHLIERIVSEDKFYEKYKLCQ